MTPVFHDEQARLSFVGHLEELRRRVFTSLIAVGICTVVGYVYSEPALRFFIAPLKDSAGAVYFFSPQEAFIVRIQVALILGIAGALPVVLSQLWLFVSPGLRGPEKRAFLPLVAFTTVLFLCGGAFCFFLVMPVALKFLMGMQTGYLLPMISVGEYIGFLGSMLFAFGVSFNLPAFLLALTASGAVKPETLSKYRRHAILIIVIAAAVLTPGPDVASQTMLAVPLYVLFEISVCASYAFVRRKKL
jgi:sec-independent protein translocase protein TatC